MIHFELVLWFSEQMRVGGRWICQLSVDWAAGAPAVPSTPLTGI